VQGLKYKPQYHKKKRTNTNSSQIAPKIEEEGILQNSFSESRITPLSKEDKGTTEKESHKLI
jgi:hypothetical protein